MTGMPGCGKSTAVELAKEKNIPVFRMGDMIWAEVRSRGLELENAVVGMIANEMREHHGPGIWAERTVEAVRKAPAAPLIIIDGCRSQDEIAVFERTFGNDLTVLAIIANQRTRFQRLKSRAREDDIRTLDDLRERDKREVRWGLDKVIMAADIKLRNDGTVGDLRKEMARILADMSGIGPKRTKG